MEGSKHSLVLHWNTKTIKKASVVMLLLHPFPYDARAWDLVLPELADLPVVCPDMPGCGLSRLWEDTRFEPVADDLVAELQRQGVEKVVAVGCSMGGYLALALAERHPQFLAGLALVDTKAGGEPAENLENREAVACRAEAEGARFLADTCREMVGKTAAEAFPEIIRKCQSQLAAIRPAGVAWCSRAIAARPDRLQVVANFSKPLYLIRGGEDTVSTAADYQLMQDANAAARLVMLEKSGHLPMFATPVQLGEVLQELWAEVNAF